MIEYNDLGHIPLSSKEHHIEYNSDTCNHKIAHTPRHSTALPPPM